MHAHAGPLAHRRERQVIPYAQLIDGMTGLMDHRKQGAVHAVRVMGGDTHILVVKVGGKRMGADRHNAPVKVKSHIFRQEPPQLLLLFLRVIAL